MEGVYTEFSEKDGGASKHKQKKGWREYIRKHSMLQLVVLKCIHVNLIYNLLITHAILQLQLLVHWYRSLSAYLVMNYLSPSLVTQLHLFLLSLHMQSCLLYLTPPCFLYLTHELQIDLSFLTCLFWHALWKFHIVALKICVTWWVSILKGQECQ